VQTAIKRAAVLLKAEGQVSDKGGAA